MSRIIKGDSATQNLSRDLDDLRNEFKTRNIEMRGRRVVGAGPSKATDDYIIRGELNKALYKLEVENARLREDIVRLSKRVTALE